MKCNHCEYHSCQTHLGEHMNAHSELGFKKVVLRIQQGEYDSLQVEAQQRKEILSRRQAEVLQERNGQAALYLEKLRDLDLKYARILEELALEQMSIDSWLEQIQKRMALRVNAGNPGQSNLRGTLINRIPNHDQPPPRDRLHRSHPQGRSGTDVVGDRGRAAAHHRHLPLFATVAPGKHHYRCPVF